MSSKKIAKIPALFVLLILSLGEIYILHSAYWGQVISELSFHKKLPIKLLRHF